MVFMRFFSKRNKSILREMVVTDFKLRYQGSLLGYLWSLMRPMFMFLVLYLVFVVFFKVGDQIPNFAVYLLLGIVMWTFFLEVTSNGLNAIVGRGELLRKISIPRYLLVVSVSISALINLFLNLVVVLVFAIISGVDFRWTAILLPFVLLELYIFSLALAFILSALFVRYRDMSHIWEIILQAAFYATPIVYPLSLAPEQFKALIMTSPVAQTIQDARFLLVTDVTETSWSVLGKYVWVPFTVVMVFSMVSFLYFRKAQRTFAEDL